MTESYSDRLMRLLAALGNNAMDRPETRKLKHETIIFIREQAAMIVRLEAELSVAYA